MTKERLAQIEKTWMGEDQRGLAIIGSSSYKMIAELILECKILANEVGYEHSIIPFPEMDRRLSSDLVI